MKTVLVMDVPAESGGALTILLQFYHKALEDKSKNWIFVTSLPILEETSNIKNVRFPWVKKSWFHRLYFDNIVAPRLVKKYKADEILSLQNVIVPNVKTPQTLYVHQSLPFIDRRFSLRENKLFWIYQNVIGKSIFKSMRKANKIIVQANWMKNVSIDKVGVSAEKIVVDPPVIGKSNKTFKETYENFKTFFYPASGLTYKNHELILKATELLKSRGINDFKIIFTLSEDENEYTKSLYNKVKGENLPIHFVGNMRYEDVLQQYTQSVLLFPSYIETFGLPMLEARNHDAPVIASDMPFSHEILDGYNKATFFDSTDEKELARLMKLSIDHQSVGKHLEHTVR